MWVQALFFLKRQTPMMPRSHRHMIDLPVGPPPEVLDEIDLAWERAQRPLDIGCELHFDSDPRSRRAWGELRGPDGAVTRRLSATEALSLACGEPLGLMPAVA
jgi:hypothetical protein